MRRLFWIAGLCGATSGCISNATNENIDRALAQSSAPLRARPAQTDAQPDLSGPLRRETVIALAVARSPAIAAMAHRARAMVHGARAEGSLPPAELALEAWNLPLARPYAVDEAEMYMVELRQRFPAVGSLDARARAMAEQAQAMLAELADEERQIALRAAEAYADYVRTARDGAIRKDHLGLLEQMQGAARARFSAGGAGLADAARIDLELAKARRALARVDGDMTRARAALNALLRRPEAAPLGPPSDLAPMTVQLSAEELAARASQHRAPLLRAEDRIRAMQAEREAAEAEARWPEFMVGVSYWQHPDMRPGYGANVSMSLPWLWGDKRERVGEARERQAAEAAALAAAAVDAQSEITEGLARVVTAERELQLLHTEALPAAKRSIDAIRAVYSTGSANLLEWIDAARSFLDLQLEETELAAEIARAVATLERSVGTALPLTPIVNEDAR